MNTPSSDTLTHWIDGQRTALDSTRSADVFDPALGQVARQVLLASDADVSRAVASAAAAQPEIGRAHV